MLLLIGLEDTDVLALRLLYPVYYLLNLISQQQKSQMDLNNLTKGNLGWKSFNLSRRLRVDKKIILFLVKEKQSG
jgi:hypothetical protein